jgi:hypothetical protein
MQINREWHLNNKMPKNPTFEQSVQWHLEHEKNCQCRPIPAKLLEEMAKIKAKPNNDLLLSLAFFFL